MAHGAYLAEVTSPGENSFVSNLVKQNHRKFSQYFRLLPNLSGHKEGSVLFNDALNTFYLRLYAVGNNMVNQIC